MRGRFYVLEGIDGSGKTTQALMLAQKLRETGRKVLSTSEPRGTLLGCEIRVIIERGGLLPLTEALLHNAARHEHIEKVIRPALADGTDVVCDRYLMTTFAYQGAGGGADMHSLNQITAQLEPVCPDKTFVLEIDVDTAMARVAFRGTKIGIHESQGVGFLERAQNEYLRHVNRLRFIRISATGSREETFKRIWKHIKP